MIKIIGIGGPPASGKTFLFRKFMQSTGGFWIQIKQKLLVWSEDALSKKIVLGDYSQGIFGGTDKLSMAVQPVALKIIQSWAIGLDDGWTVLFEGDRLFNSSFIQSLQSTPNLDCSWVVLQTEEDILKQRHKDRNDGQKENWLAGRKTKLANIQAAIPDIKCWNNNTPEETDKNVRRLQRLCQV